MIGTVHNTSNKRWADAAAVSGDTFRQTREGDAVWEIGGGRFGILQAAWDFDSRECQFRSAGTSIAWIHEMARFSAKNEEVDAADGGDEMKVTRTFPADVKPVRTGVYQVDIKIAKAFGLPCYWAYWNGKRWSPCSDTAWAAARMKHRRASFQDKIWRGAAV